MIFLYFRTVKTLPMTRPHPYRPPLPPPPAVLIRVDTCDMRIYAFLETRTAIAHHLRGRRWLHTPTTAHCSLFTAHWTYTFSAKEKDLETGLSYFGSRYYSSDLSIWLSVDPKSDKYPSMSPYVYCADNPIKLMDPNGEEWVSDKDKQYAQSLIKEAQNRQKQYKSTDNEYKVLQEGIDGLTAMGEEKGQKYGFQKSESTSGCITKKEGVIYMNYIEHESFSEQKDASAWHEAVHLTRYNIWRQNGEPESQTQFTWKSIDNGVSIIAFSSNDLFEETYTTYSTMCFSPNSVRFINGTKATDFIGIKEYMLRKDKYKNCSLSGFRLSDGINGRWLNK